MHGFAPVLRSGLVLAAFFVAGCQANVPAVRVAPARSHAASAPPKDATVLGGRISDANVIAVLMASASTDISFANLVAARSSNPAVITFADRMASDHGRVNAMALKVASLGNIEPKENFASLDMREVSAIRRDILRDLTGSAFDAQYINNEIAWNRQFLDSIDRVLLPQSEDVQLRRLLVGIRPSVAAHLAHAERIKASLGGNTALQAASR